MMRKQNKPAVANNLRNFIVRVNIIVQYTLLYLYRYILLLLLYILGKVYLYMMCNSGWGEVSIIIKREEEEEVSYR